MELDDAIGKNDGSLKGIRFFTCKPKFGECFCDSRKLFYVWLEVVSTYAIQLHVQLVRYWMKLKVKLYNVLPHVWWRDSTSLCKFFACYLYLFVYFFFCLVHAQGSLCPCIGYRRLLRSTSRLRGEISLPMEGERESPSLSLLGPLRLREPWLSLLTSRCLSLSHTHTHHTYIHTHSHTNIHTLHTYFSNIHTHSFSLSHTQTYMHYLSISQTYHIHTLNNM